MFWYVVFGFIALYFGFILYSNKYINPFYIEMYFAPPGTGKTLFLQKLSHNHKKRGWTVYTTDKNIDGVYIPPDKIGKYIFSGDKNVLIIDEASILFNNRDYKNFGKDLIKWFKLHRHFSTRIIMSSQSYRDVDLTIRNLCTRYYLLSRFAGLWIVAKKIRKEIALTEAIGEQGGTIAEQYIYEPFFFRGARLYAFLPHWVKFTNSFDMSMLTLPIYEPSTPLRREGENIGGSV